jgi:cytidylate kinase
VKKIIIAIDGYSSCGKSTIARELANALNYHYVDTGAMYRALTLYLFQNQIDILHPEMVATALPQITISFGFDETTQTQITLLNGENVEREIRINPRIASMVSDVSALSAVRKFLVEQQKTLGNEKGIVMDGRDIGTVVFPEAELKLFITAKPNIRAQRRLEELADKGQDTTYDEVLANLTKRDYLDTTRLDSPLLKAEDAIEIDNSFLSKEDQFEKVFQLAKKAIGEELGSK